MHYAILPNKNGNIAKLFTPRNVISEVHKTKVQWRGCKHLIWSREIPTAFENKKTSHCI